jgi:hypothetical protein
MPGTQQQRELDRSLASPEMSPVANFQRLMKYRLIKLSGPIGVGMRQRRFLGSRFNSQMLYLAANRRQTPSYLTKRVGPGKLRKQQRHELVPG